MYGYRRYGYGGFGTALPRAVKYLLIANVAVYLVLLFFPYRILLVAFGLVPELVTSRFMIWQFFTYMFMQYEFSHIFFNMFALWMFGRELEHNWGFRDFLYYYLACGVGGGVLVWLTSLVGLSPGDVPTIGASGAVYGIMVAYALMWPNRVILLFMVIPMKAYIFVLLFVGYDLYRGLGQMGGGVAYFAHVGGAVTGYIYLKYGWRMLVHVESWWKRFRAQQKARERKFTIHEGGKQSGSKKTGAPHPDRDAEVDRILDKIAREGMDSLSDRERRILDNASKRGKH